MFGKIIACRFCKSRKIEPYLDLGFHPHSDSFLLPKELHEPEIYYPLVVVFCKNCGLSQLSYTVDPKILYQKNYLYESSITRTGVNHYHNFAHTVAKKFKLDQKDLVVDIGSNVGTLLEGFKNDGTKILGIDPAKNIAKIASQRGIKTIPDFFTTKLAYFVRKKYGPASIIVGTNVFAHLYDHDEFMKSLKILLKPEGVFIFESPHFVDLVRNLEYDTIYHQHLLYLSLRPLLKFFRKFGMEVFDVEKYKIHGGSFRAFIGYKNVHKKTQAVQKFLAFEKRAGIFNIKKLREFAKKVQDHRLALNFLLKSLKEKNKRVAIISTPAKGMTLLNYCRIGPELVDFATEKSKLKIGRFTPGTHIPIFPDSKLLRRQPDYALILAWNFADEIMKNLKDYKKCGGKFIIPIPKPKIK